MAAVDQRLLGYLSWRGTVDPDAATEGDLRVDARRVRPGDVFVALAGTRSHGNDYLQQAAEQGAAWALTGQEPEAAVLPYAYVPGLERELYELAMRRYPVDWKRVRVVAVTGTNGKTSVTHMLVHAAGRAGMAAAVIGTVGYAGPGHSEAATETTPHFVDLLRLIHRWQPATGELLVAVEASSHGLSQGRLGRLPVDVAVLTNISQDHLDYHGDMAAYRRAKAGLFEAAAGRSAAAVVPAAEPEMVAAAEGAGRTAWRFGAGDAETVVRRTAAAPGGTTVELMVHRQAVTVELHAAGAFHGENAAAALGALTVLGLPPVEAARALAGWEAAPGRLERVLERPAAFVDYAHTPAALASSLAAVRGIVPGSRVIVVFGCGGDRDRAKRPQMGRIAEHGADVVVLTSDNPRSEDPDAILTEIQAGMAAPESAVVEPDRRAAIRRALDLAAPEDAVLVAGKGHETVQILDGRTVDFNDREEIAKWACQ